MSKKEQLQENKTQEVTQEVQQEAKPEAKPKAQKAAKKPVDKSVYDKYTDLKFCELSGVKLTEDVKKELTALEIEVKSYDGVKAKVTQRAAINNEQVLLVKDVPIPAEYLKIINISRNPSYYV
jgi:hypothetical protein